MPEKSADDDHLDNDRLAKDPLESDRPENDRADSDRRRSARFICGGYAKISRLPSDGIFVPGRILDLSLHGCCVDTPVPIDCGTRAEIVVRVNAASFRAVGEVKAMRGRSVAGMEFVHLSAGGKDLLADMVTDLARLQAIMNKLRNVRREMDAESFQKELEDGKRHAAVLSERYPFLGTIFQTESSGESSRESSRESSVATPGKSAEPKAIGSGGRDRIAGGEALVITVDLFG
jgi:hypothetical protein